MNAADLDIFGQMGYETSASMGRANGPLNQGEFHEKTDFCDLWDADSARWQLALLAIDLLVAAPQGLGGILLRARSGPVRDAWEAALVQALRCRRLQASADGDALDGGLDLTATLASGRPVRRDGLLADAAGGALVVPMAERLSPGVAARLAAAADAGGPALILFDEGDGDEGVTAALAGRLAMHVDLGAVRLPMADLLAEHPIGHSGDGRDPAALSCGGEKLDPGLRRDDRGGSLVDDDAAATLTATALALGIEVVTAPLQALRVARAHARVNGRTMLTSADLEAAAALVLGPRATRIPGNDAPPPPDEPPPPPPETDDGDDDREPDHDDLNAQTEILLEAAQTALPPGLLEALAAGQVRRQPTRGSGAGAKLRSQSHGRPAGVRAGTPGRGARLALIDTIKAAAPWQRLRQADPTGRLSIRRDDLRIRRYVARTQTTTVFAVDASGSAAIARLAEAKGAVELLLAQAYVKRSEVALVVFRGEAAEVLLPPTRSLARAKRSLAELAGGGGTPLAAGIDLAGAVAVREAARGRTPLVVVLTDGRANVDAAGRDPQEAALVSARGFAAAGLKSVFIDCGKRPRPEAAAIAHAMAARYVALPRLDARAVVAAVEAMG